MFFFFFFFFFFFWGGGGEGAGGGLSENFHFLVVKFSIYLNRRVTALERSIVNTTMNVEMGEGVNRFYWYQIFK